MISKMNGNKNLVILLTAVTVYSMALFSHLSFEKPLIIISKQDSSVNFNEDFLRIFSIGNKKLLSDVLWVQTLLDSDLEHYGKKDLGGWMFIRFMSISALDPLFYENYYYGGLYLSIVKDDIYGAAALYDKGLKIYPDDYNLNYNAGFNYYFEMGDYERGLPLLDKIKDHPKAPGQLVSIVNKLKLAMGMSIEIVYQLVEDRFKIATDPILKEKLHDELYSIRAEIDLECLNSGKEGCSRKDYSGNYYIYQNGKFSAGKKFKPYRLIDKIKKQ